MRGLGNCFLVLGLGHLFSLGHVRLFRYKFLGAYAMPIVIRQGLVMMGTQLMI